MKTDCLLTSEAALAFNVIYDPACAHIQAELLETRTSETPFSFAPATKSEESSHTRRRHTFILCLKGNVNVASSLFEQERLVELDLLHLEQESAAEQVELRFSQGAEQLVVELTI